jgi:hypothetical protein
VPSARERPFLEAFRESADEPVALCRVWHAQRSFDSVDDGGVLVAARLQDLLLRPLLVPHSPQEERPGAGNDRDGCGGDGHGDTADEDEPDGEEGKNDREERRTNVGPVERFLSASRHP